MRYTLGKLWELELQEFAVLAWELKHIEHIDCVVEAEIDDDDFGVEVEVELLGKFVVSYSASCNSSTKCFIALIS